MAKYVKYYHKRRSVAKSLLRYILLAVVIFTTLAFIGVQPLSAYKDTIIQSVKTGATHVKGILPLPLAKLSIIDVTGNSTFVVRIEPHKDAIDVNEIYCVVLLDKSGYIFSHETLFWHAFEFKEQAMDDRTTKERLNGLRVVRLSAPAMDKAISPMRQEISLLVAEKKKKEESDFNEWYWDGKSLAPYSEESLQKRYTVSSDERASIARKYVDVKIMTYDEYILLKDINGQ